MKEIRTAFKIVLGIELRKKKSTHNFNFSLVWGQLDFLPTFGGLGGWAVLVLTRRCPSRGPFGPQAVLLYQKYTMEISKLTDFPCQLISCKINMNQHISTEFNVNLKKIPMLGSVWTARWALTLYVIILMIFQEVQFNNFLVINFECEK